MERFLIFHPFSRPICPYVRTPVIGSAVLAVSVRGCDQYHIQARTNHATSVAIGRIYALCAWIYAAYIQGLEVSYEPPSL